MNQIPRKAQQAPAAPPKTTPSGRTQTFVDDAIVTVLVANPKKAGSKAHARWSAGYPAKDGTISVKDALAAGILMADLKYDSAHKFVKIA